MLVEAVGGAFDAEVREELARVPRVFAEDQVRRLQRLDRARRKIAEVAERRADDEELAGHGGSVPLVSKLRASRIAAESDARSAISIRGDMRIGDRPRDVRERRRKARPLAAEREDRVFGATADRRSRRRGIGGDRRRHAVARATRRSSNVTTGTVRIAPAEERIAFGPNAIGAAGEERDAVRVERRREPHDRADVAGILHAVERDDDRRLAREERRQIEARPFEKRDHVLRRLRFRQRIEDLRTRNRRRASDRP